MSTELAKHNSLLFWMAAVIGAAAGALAGAFGKGLADGALIGVVASLVVTWLFSLAPRSPMAAAVAVEGLAPAGLLAGLAASLYADANLLGGLLACGVGVALGVIIPGTLVGLAMRKRD